LNDRDDYSTFALVGAGWRAEFFLRVARLRPEFRAVGVVVRDPDRRRAVEAEWRVPCFASTAELLRAVRPSYAIACVSQPAMPEACLELAEHGLPLLMETPPATDIDALISLYRALTDGDARVQVAEQFWAQPLHAARQAVVDTGVLGRIDHVNLSVCHDYHAMSLIRRLLGVGFDTAVIRGSQFKSHFVAGPDRHGPPAVERVVDVDNDHAVLDFGGRRAVYEFCLPQYWSWIRGQRVCIRGERGEIVDDRVTFLKDVRTPITSRLIRHEAGVNGNHEGYHLKGLQFLGDWVFENPFAPSRMNDEEIAIATCLQAMREYLQSGKDFYSLADASQDQYLALCCRKAIDSGETVVAEPQAWSGQG